MDKSNYEPSFEVVDKAEEAEDYLLAKNRPKGDRPHRTQKGDSTDSNSNISTNKKNDTATANDTTEKGMMNLPFMSGTTECNNEVIPDTTVTTTEDELKCVTEDEEGQEALWLEEAEVTPSASTATSSPAVAKSPKRRSSFLFSSSKKAAAASTIAPKRTISFRKKRNAPKIMLLDGGILDVKNGAALALVPTVSSDGEAAPVSTSRDAVAGQQPDAVIASDTISSLGFDKSFDVKSPLSMSSLNEILDAPPTPTATGTIESANIVASSDNSITKKGKRKSIVRGMFRKKDKKVNSPKTSFSFLNRYARSVNVVDKESDDGEDDDDDDADPGLRTTRDIDQRIQESLLRAMENDDAESLTSFSGVPMIMKELNHSKQQSNVKPKSITVLPGQRPLNFEKIKPTFVVSKDGLTLAQIQEKFVPMDFADEEEEEDDHANAQRKLASSSTVDQSTDGEEIEALKSSSPNSSGGADSAVTDRYEVARNIDDDDNESDNDDGKSDKYSVLPDPCSFCDSFWINTENPPTVSKTMSESPDIKRSEPKFESEQSAFDAPVIDKYSALLPEAVATTSNNNRNANTEHVSNAEEEDEESTSEKQTTVVATKRTMSSFFGKTKRPTASSELPEMASSPEPEEMAIEESNGSEHAKVVSSKRTMSSFFGKTKRPTSSYDLPEVVATSRNIGLAPPEPEDTVLEESTTDDEAKIVSSKRNALSIFGKTKRPPSNTAPDLPEMTVDGNNDARSRVLGRSLPEPEGIVPVEPIVDEQSTVVASKRTMSNFFGTAKRPTSVSELHEIVPVSGSGNDLGLSSPERGEDVPVEPVSNEAAFTIEDRKISIPAESTVVATKSTSSSFFGKFKRPSKEIDVPIDPTMSVVESSMNTSTIKPRKSILKKRKDVVMIPVDGPMSYVVPGKDVESPGAKISILSLGSEPYVVPAATTNTTFTSKTTMNSTEHAPVEDPSTEGSSSADDEATTNATASNAHTTTNSTSTTTTTTDPLLVRLRRILHLRSPTRQQQPLRGLEPHVGDVDPIITVGHGRTRLDP